MNFFEHQDRARRSAAVMVALFIVAVAAVLAFMNFLGLAVHAFLTGRPNAFDSVRGLLAAPYWVYAVSTVFSLGLIALGSWARMLDLEGGGVALARMIGARRARPAQHLNERRLLNVVEEMAVASGVNVPEVFIMDKERRINALAAGHAPNEAVLIVTRGTLEWLERDELQGVVAHEFSHILNGDIRLNMHIVRTIAGIVVIGGFGRAYAMFWFMFPIAVPMWLIGSVGTLAGRLIRAAVARQREFLADAAAVQLTRNPAGIAGALYKMGLRGGLVSERHASELSHMYFGEPVKSWFGWLQTHPPVQQRIERIMGPGWSVAMPGRATSVRRDVPAAGRPATAPMQALRTSAQALAGSVGHPSSEHVELARQILAQLPGEIHEAIGTEAGATAALFALLMADRQSRAPRLEVLRSRAGAQTAASAGRFAAALDDLGPCMRMPLLELAMPALKGSSAGQRAQLLETTVAVMASGHKATLPDFVFLTLCRRHLGATRQDPPPVKHKSLVTVASQAAVTISLLVHCAGSGERAFHRAMAQLGLTGQRMFAAQELNLAVVEGALYELKLLAALKKSILVQACFGVVIADERISVSEGELMRAICAAIDSPLPPLVEGY